nr:hypothetical protein [Tanacetum cinerariifolium]
MNNEPPQTLLSFDLTCYSEKENSLPCVSKHNFVDESPNVFNPPPQPPIYYCEFCGRNAQYDHYCTPQVLEPGYSQDFNFPQDFHDFQQQYLCCDQCGGPHETFQCQQVIFYEPCCENYGGFEQTQPPQFPVIHPPPQETSIKILHDQENDAFGNKQYKPEDIQELFRKLLNDLQNIHEELAEYINSPGWNRPAFYDDDDDDDVDYTISITPVLSTEEPDNSLIPYISKPNFVDESSKNFNPPPQHHMYPCEFCGNDAYFGHYCTPQAQFNNPEQGYSQDFNFPHAQNTIMEQMTQLTSMCELVCQIFQKKQEDKRIEEEQAASARYWNIPACCDDDDDYDSAITPVLSTEETDNSLCMGDEHLDTILATESDELIKSSVKDLVLIPSESEENIEYVEVSPHDSELVSLEMSEIVIPEEEKIEDDNLRKKLLNVHLLIANIEALKDNPTPSSKLLTKSSSTSPKSFLEETNTFHNSLPKFENFCFDLEEISSSSTTTHSDISLSDYEAFYFDDDHIK